MKRNKNKFLSIFTLLYTVVSFDAHSVEENVAELRCMDDKSYKSIVQTINADINNLTQKHPLIDEVNSMIKFSLESRPLVNFLGEQGEVIKNLQEEHTNNNLSDYYYLKKINTIDPTGIVTNDFNTLSAANKDLRIQSDFHLISLAILSKLLKENLLTQNDKSKFIDQELEKYKGKYASEDNGYQFPENFLETTKSKILKAMAKPPGEIQRSIPVAPNSESLFDDFVQKYVNVTTSNDSDKCSPAQQESTPPSTDKEAMAMLQRCADLLESQSFYYTLLTKNKDSVIPLDSASNEKKHFRLLTNDTVITSASNIRPAVERRKISHSEKKELKQKMINVLDNYNTLMQNHWDKEKQTGLHEKIQASYNNISMNTNGVNLFNKDYPYDCSQDIDQQDTAKLKICLGQIQEINNYDAKTNSFALINKLSKVDPNNLDQGRKSQITDLMKNNFPSEKLVAYLNLLNFAKNKYLASSSDDPKCIKTDGLVKCVQDHEKGLHTGLKTILKLSDKLQSNYSSANSLSEIDRAAIKNSCDLINPPEGVLKYMCNGVKVEDSKIQTSAYSRYQRGEIPFHDGQSWKWKKKTSNLEHFTAGTLHGVQQGFPTWLNLMQTKNAIHYESERAIYMKQYNYMQNQYMQNWLKNYYSTPQTFSNGYYNIYNLNGNSYGTGFGF